MERSYWASLLFHGGMDLAAEVKRLEAGSVTGITIPQVYGPPFVPLAAAATVSNRLQLGTGIAIGLVRSPFETAMAFMKRREFCAGNLGYSQPDHGPAHNEKAETPTNSCDY